MVYMIGGAQTKKKPVSFDTGFLYKCGGEGGIRTPGRNEPTSDFKSGALSRALPPLRSVSTLPVNWLSVEDGENDNELLPTCKA